MSQQKGKLHKKLGSMLLSIFLVAVSAFFIINIVYAQMDTRRLEELLSSKQAELAQLERDREELIKQKEKLSDPEYIKDYARGNFMLSEENEQIFILPSKDN